MKKPTKLEARLNKKIQKITFAKKKLDLKKIEEANAPLPEPQQ